MTSSTYFFSNLFTLNWRIMALQYHVGFCHTSTWIGHRCMHVPSVLNLPPPHPTPPGGHRAPVWAPCIRQQIPAAYLFTHGTLSVVPPRTNYMQRAVAQDESTEGSLQPTCLAFPLGRSNGTTAEALSTSWPRQWCPRAPPSQRESYGQRETAGLYAVLTFESHHKMHILGQS